MWRGSEALGIGHVVVENGWERTNVFNVEVWGMVMGMKVFRRYVG